MKRLSRNLTAQVLFAVACGVALGVLDPALAKQMRPLGDTFVKLVKMVIGPIIFLTIVLGIARIADVKKIGRVGGKALLYFEIVTSFALVFLFGIHELTMSSLLYGPSTKTFAVQVLAAEEAGVATRIVAAC